MEDRFILEIRRTFPAPPRRVFQAFRDPSVLRQWAAPDQHRTEEVEMDFRIGGRYRRELRFPDGSLHVLRGEYLEIDPPNRLVYTYEWETIPDAPSTRVEIELEERDGGTDLRLVHSGFESREARDEHRTGWASCFDQLTGLVES